jgi:rhamnulokinase
LDGERLSVDELHRFPNVPVRARGILSWDAPRLYDGILTGLRAAARAAGARVDSVGVDTWGVDFALLDGAGRMLRNPAHHRDRRTDGVMELVLARVPARDIYERTGIQLMPFNTLFQLRAMAAAGDPALETAETLLFMADLFHYWLCGSRVSEFTIATTSQCFDTREGGWARDLLERVEVPIELLPEVVSPGTVLGPLRAELADDAGLTATAVVAPATHDTAAAVAAVPFRRPSSVYISSGTWSLVGMEVGAPVVDDRTFAANLTNEGGVAGTFRLLKNVTGLWLLQECRRAWALGGAEHQFGELVAEAQTPPPLQALIDPNDPAFLPPGDMPERIRARCAATGQTPPETRAAVVRCILESLALKYRETIELLESATGLAPQEIHVVGGGSLNRPLCQWTADAAGLPVVAGPVEAAGIGNLIVQAIGLGELSSLDEARHVVRASFELELYEPGPRDPWDEAYARFAKLSELPDEAQALVGRRD